MAAEPTEEKKAEQEQIFGQAKESWLGAIYFGSYHRLEVPYEDFKAFAEEVGLEEQWIPKPTRPHDAFIQACREWEQQTAEVADGATGEDKAKVISEYRILGIEGKPRARDWVRITTHPNRQPEKTALGRFEFDAAENVVVTIYDDAKTAGLEQHVRDVGEQISARTETLKKALREDDIRQMAAKLLRNVNQLKLRDGVYFVPREHAGLVEKLEALVKKLGPYHKLGEHSELRGIPYPDIPKLRELVYVKFESATLGAIQKMLESVTPALKSGDQFPKAAFAAHMKELERLKAAKEQYTGLLESTMEKVDTQLEVLKAQLTKLAEKLEE